MTKNLFNKKRLLLILFFLVATNWVCIGSTRSDSGAELIIAVKARDSKSVEQLIRKGVDVDQKDEKGVTALIFASAVGDLKIIDTLLQNGANVNARPKTGYTALMVAARAGKVDAVQRLIKAGADVNARTYMGEGLAYTPLIAAAWADQPQPEAINFLLKSGAAKDRVSIINAVTLSKERKFESNVKELTKTLRKTELILLFFQWKSWNRMIFGLLVAVLGVLIWPILSFRKSFNPLMATRLKKIFCLQLIVHAVFIFGSVILLLTAGWQMSSGLFGMIAFSYYFALAGSLGIIASLMAVISTDQNHHFGSEPLRHAQS